MTAGDLGEVIVDASSSGELWTVWNKRYGRTDSGDMGFIALENGQYVAHGRGDIPRQLGMFDTLEGAVGALRAAY